MPIRSNIAQCIHFKLNGQRCGSPAVLGDRYCHWHQRLAATTKAHVNSALANVLLLEDADSVQAALIHVIDLLLRDQIPLQKARTILKAIELASRNVKNLGVALSTEQYAEREVNLIEKMNLEEQTKWMEQRRVKRQEIEAELALPETEAEQAPKVEMQEVEEKQSETPVPRVASDRSETSASEEWHEPAQAMICDPCINKGCRQLRRT